MQWLTSSSPSSLRRLRSSKMRTPGLPRPAGPCGGYLAAWCWHCLCPCNAAGLSGRLSDEECLRHYILAPSPVSGVKRCVSTTRGEAGGRGHPGPGEGWGPWSPGWRGGTWVSMERLHSTSLILPCTMAAGNSGWLVLEHQGFTVQCWGAELGKENELESQIRHSWCNLHNRGQGGINCWLTSWWILYFRQLRKRNNSNLHCSWRSFNIEGLRSADYIRFQKLLLRVKNV